MGKYRVADVIKVLRENIPEKLAADFDNMGFQVGDPENEVRGIVLALDVTDDVIDFTLQNGCNMIITHHPLIFSPLKSVTTQGAVEKLVYKLISNGISLYSAHTSFDRVNGGTDDVLAEIIGMKEPKRLETGVEYGFGRIGAVKITAGELKSRLENALGGKLVTTARDDRIIRVAASCAGAGADLMSDAIEQGADIFVTGEASYHEVLDAKRLGMDVILCTHQLSEQISIDVLKNTLQNHLNGVQYKVQLILAPFEPMWH